MFQYTHEVIINSLKREGLDVFDAKPGVLNILRAGSYKKEHIVDGIIYKTVGYEGTMSELILDFSDVTAFKDDGVYRLTIFTKMPNKFLGEYANSNWYEFGKPLMVEFACFGDAVSKDIMEQVTKVLKLALPENNQWLRITNDGKNKVTVATKDPYMIFSGVTLEYYEPTACDSCVGYYEKRQAVSYSDFEATTNFEIKNGMEPFATAAWITENLRFPSYPNVRYASPNSDEIPTPGAVYVMYSFAYDVVRKGLGGLSVVGQKTESVTRHIYYVRQDIADQFDAAIKEAFGEDVKLIESYVVNIISADTAEAGKTVQLMAETYPNVDSTQLKWSTSAEAEVASITEDGKLSVEAGKEDETFTVTCEVEVSVGERAYKSATKTITVVAAKE